jgi:hypothetical protein
MMTSDISARRTTRMKEEMELDAEFVTGVMGSVGGEVVLAVDLGPST